MLTLDANSIAVASTVLDGFLQAVREIAGGRDQNEISLALLDECAASAFNGLARLQDQCQETAGD